MTNLEFTYSLQEALNNMKPKAFKLTRNLDEANDLLQETYVRAFTQKGRFLEGSNLNAWIYTIMKNIFINNYQRMMRRQTFLDASELQFFINNPGKAEKRTIQDLEADTRNEIKTALRLLEKEQRTPFLLYFTGYKYHEIATKLNIPLGTVKTRIHNARKILQQYLRDYEFNY